MLASLAASLATALIPKVLDAFVSYNNKQISLAELQTRLSQSLLDCFAEVNKAQADALAKTYASFMGAVQTSRLMQAVWASVVVSQLLVLLWHQIGIPALVYFAAARYPSSGTTVDWAYLLLAFCLGAGPVVLNSGPGRINAGALKTLIGK